MSLALSLGACDQSSTHTIELQGATMGTTYSVVVSDAPHGLDEATLRSAVEERLAAVSDKMSNWDPTSEVSRLNGSDAQTPIPLSPELYTVLEAAQQVHRDSNGYFDVTLGPLIELWGFGAPERTSEPPAPSALEEARLRTGQDRVLALSASPPALRKLHPDANVYLAALAKGYGVDQVASELRAQGLGDFLVEIGGDLFAAGVNPRGMPWRIGVEKPDARSRTVQRVVPVSGRGMATSGDYRNYFEQDGVRYSHIIDPQTGRPIAHSTASVTVLAGNAMLADAWATALLAMGHERGLPLARSLGLAVLFIYRAPQRDALSFTSVSSDAFDALIDAPGEHTL